MREREERVEAHARRDGEGQPRVEAHEQRHAERDEHRGRHRAGEGHAGARCREDRGIDHHDVGHREERGDAADDVGGQEVRSGSVIASGFLIPDSRSLIPGATFGISGIVRDVSDLVVVGAGAAGLATAIFAARAAPDLRVRCLDGARHIGAKILVSGGSRCNVTNREVTERDFWGGSSRVVRNVLRAFPADRAAAFFEELGVRLHEEEDGKLFPDTNRSRTVLDALLAEARALGVAHRHRSSRARGLRRSDGGASPARDVASDGIVTSSRAVVIATGGRSLPEDRQRRSRIRPGSSASGTATSRRRRRWRRSCSMAIVTRHWPASRMPRRSACA